MLFSSLYRKAFCSMVLGFSLIFLQVFSTTPDPYEYLDQLALEAGTDKSSAFHDYTRVYAKYFDAIKDKPLRFLEIGIYKGHSVKLWESYFPHAELHFIDISSDLIQYYSSRSHYHFIDQTDSRGLKIFAESVGDGFDIILDDGGHTMNQQIISFKALFPYIKTGGMYIIEDLHTSYWKSYGGGGSVANPVQGPKTCIAFLQRLVDDLNYTGAKTTCAGDHAISPELRSTLNYYQEHIESIHFYKSLCFIFKK